MHIGYWVGIPSIFSVSSIGSSLTFSRRSKVVTVFSFLPLSDPLNMRFLQILCEKNINNYAAKEIQINFFLLIRLFLNQLIFRVPLYRIPELYFYYEDILYEQQENEVEIEDEAQKNEQEDQFHVMFVSLQVSCYLNFKRKQL